MHNAGTEMAVEYGIDERMDCDSDWHRNGY